MEVHLETDETLEIFVDGTCQFQIQGYRDEEGTMILSVKKSTNTDSNKSTVYDTVK